MLKRLLPDAKSRELLYALLWQESFRKPREAVLYEWELRKPSIGSSRLNAIESTTTSAYLQFTPRRALNSILTLVRDLGRTEGLPCH